MGPRRTAAVVATEPLPPRLAALATVRERTPWPGGGFPQPGELPEVAALVARGWHAFDSAPYTLCLPAVWPPAHRCWVADRLPKVSLGNGCAIPWTPEDHADTAAENARFAAEAGLPPPPPGRLWLVRSPWPGLAAREVLDAFHRRLHERGLRETGAGLTEVAREVLAWPEPAVAAYVR